MLRFPLSPSSAARHLLLARMRVGGFNPGQPRDEHGRWTDSESDAVQNYSAGSQQINEALRSGTPIPKGYQKDADALDVLTTSKALPAGLRKVYRAVPKEIADAYVDGQTVVEKGFLSTSTSKDILTQLSDEDSGIDFNGWQTIEIMLPKHATGVDVNIALRSRDNYFQTQREVILPRNRSYDVSRKGSQIILKPARIKTLGGPGSGNFGHAGRPGEVGGSSEGLAAGDSISETQLDTIFPRASATVDGRTVLKEIPNTSSIDGISDDVEVLPGVREVPLSLFDPKYTGRSYSATEDARTDKLAEEIKASKEISPLIVVVDNERYPYILEGGHRFDALIRLKAKSFPAIIVVDKTLRSIRTAGGPGSGNFGHAGRPGERGGSLLSEPKATDFSRPVVGIISSSGEVKTRNSNAQFNSHEQMFGERRPAHHRFRVEGSEVQWDEEPSADEAFRVEDHVAEHGAQVTAHAVLAGHLGGKRYFSPGDKRMLGGPGSGNFGHVGRPGEVGGSSEGNASSFFKPLSADFTLKDAEYDVNTNYPKDAMVVANVDLKLLTSGYENDFRVREMSAAMKTGDKFPPLTLELRENGTLNVLDGRTRVAALRELNVVGKVPAVIRLFDKGVESSLPAGVIVEDKHTQSLRGHRTAASKLPLHAAADAQVPKLEVLVRYAFAIGRKALPNADAAIAATAKALKALLPAALEKTVAAGIKATPEIRAAEESLRTAKPKLLTRKQAAHDWAEEHAADLIKGISKTTRERVNAAVAANTDRPLEMLGALKRALGDEDRARTIARTESMRAVHKGQEIVWQEAQDEGLLAENAKRTWIVTDDDKLCPICEPLDGKTAALDDAYDAGSEYLDGPPAHPNCRCTEGLA